MLRPNAWIVSLSASVAVLLLVASPEARTREATSAPSIPSSPSVGLLLEGCSTATARQRFEEGDCLQAARLDLAEGAITVAEAVLRLESCSRYRPELDALSRRLADLDLARLRARVAFGEAVDWSQTGVPETERRQMTAEAAAIPRSYIQLLREAGITPDGIEGVGEAPVLDRLATDAALQTAFRAAFGDLLADDVSRLLSRNPADYPAAVTIGNSVIVPNLPDRNHLGIVARAETKPLVVNLAGYADRVASELAELDANRRAYLDAAAIEHHEIGSVSAFVTSVASLGREDGVSAATRERTERARAVMLTRLYWLERRLGVDPIVYRSAQESVGNVLAIAESCAGEAEHRRRLVRGGAGTITGLMGAAGYVVAVGAASTLSGGMTIAAAVESGLGAYLVARSERAKGRELAAVRTMPDLASSPSNEEEVEDESDAGTSEEGALGEPGPGSPTGAEGPQEVGEGTLADAGDAEESDAEEEGDGRGEQNEGEGGYLDGALIEGLAWEWEGLEEGEGVEEDIPGDFTEPGPMQNTIAAVLPEAEAADMTELPPLLENAEIRELAELTLPEIQERLAAFLEQDDPTSWTSFAENLENLAPSNLAAMVSEAQSALRLWERQRVLSERFGPFFLEAELEQASPRQRQDVLERAMARYSFDRGTYVGSTSVDDLRERVATRLVAHCRAPRERGDLVLRACTDETALSLVLLAAIRDAGVSPPRGSVVGVQSFNRRYEAVLYDSITNQVYSLTRGQVTEGVVAPIFHPATFYYSYLVEHNIVPEIDPEKHLLIKLPDTEMSPEILAEECRDTRNPLRKALEWVVSMVGFVKLSSNPCTGDGSGSGTGSIPSPSNGRPNISMSVPNPLQRGGGGSGGGIGNGAGGSGGMAMSPEGGTAGGATGAGSGGPASGSGESGESGGARGGAGRGGDQAGSATGGGGTRSSEGDSIRPIFNVPVEGASSGGGPGADGPGGSPLGGGTGSGGSGGFGVGNIAVPGSNLTEVARDVSALVARYARSENEGVAPWRLREDEGMMTGSMSRVMYADNGRALDRFEEHDLFITLTPAEVEAQRRMLDADNYRIYPETTDCESTDLPPRRVFRQAAPGERGFRYVYCDHDESKVVFRDKEYAEKYANYIPPDRPLYLADLALQRLQIFDESVEMARLRAFLRDPNVVRNHSREELYAMVKTAADLLVFQNALESALVQSMYELGGSSLSGYYYDLHRQVLQAPLFIELAADVYRLNQRLASDPLQSLAWANAQPTLARQGFFDLYHTLGGMMEWPARWATLQNRYGATAATAPSQTTGRSLDFLQILSDPTRVQVDWSLENRSRASISDTQIQQGAARTSQVRPSPTMGTRPDGRLEEMHLRGGTAGEGETGEGSSVGAGRGRRETEVLYLPLSAIEGILNGQADSRDERGAERLPPAVGMEASVGREAREAAIQTRESQRAASESGGTRGRQRIQTVEGASLQEPVLYVSPGTFVEALLSTWDNNYPSPQEATRIPPILRFNERLRQVYMRDFSGLGVYNNRLRTAMGVFTDGSWLDYTEVREAMGGSLVNVRAVDTGRFSAAYSGNPPINDQDQIRIPNFFTRRGVTIPEDLFETVRVHYRDSILGIFDLNRAGQVARATPIATLPPPPGEEGIEGRNSLLRSLALVREQAAEAAASQP